MKLQSKTDIDYKEWNKLLKRLETLTDWEVEYGYYDDQMHPEHGLSLAEIARINEYGSTADRIPPRPFMRQTSELHEGDVNKFAGVVRDSLYYNKPVKTVLKEVGEQGTRYISFIVEVGAFAPNSPVTANPTEPLIQTGYLHNNAKSKVVKKDIGDK